MRAAAEFLPFRDEVFDIVFSSHMLEHLDDPAAALAEFKRVSRKYVHVILPFGLFSVFDIFAAGRNFGAHVKWLRSHHKHFFLMDPLKNGSFRLKFINVVDAILYRKKVFHGWLRVPIPFETEMVIHKND